jgi:hypothetical protein
MSHVDPRSIFSLNACGTWLTRLFRRLEQRAPAMSKSFRGPRPKPALHRRETYDHNNSGLADDFCVLPSSCMRRSNVRVPLLTAIGGPMKVSSLDVLILRCLLSAITRHCYSRSAVTTQIIGRRKTTEYRPVTDATVNRIH